jgi:hypothetical protein
MIDVLPESVSVYTDLAQIYALIEPIKTSESLKQTSLTETVSEDYHTLLP